MTHLFLLIILAPKSAVPQAPQALLDLSRRPIKIHSPNSFQAPRLILLPQAENKTGGSLGPFLISGRPIIFLLGPCISCWATLSGLFLVGTFCRLGGRSQWTPTAQAWKAYHQHTVFYCLHRRTAAAYSCPQCRCPKGCICKVHLRGPPGPPGTPCLLPFAAPCLLSASHPGCWLPATCCSALRCCGFIPFSVLLIKHLLRWHYPLPENPSPWQVPVGDFDFVALVTFETTALNMNGTTCVNL